jgi:Kef-type K+ transport system membrane component KefB
MERQLPVLAIEQNLLDGQLAQLKLPAWGYVVLLLSLFVIPRILQRNKIPRAITCFALGILTALIVTSPPFNFDTHDVAIELLATLGIVSLFLFAGLEVDTAVIRKHAGVFSTYFAVGLIGLCAIALLLGGILDVDTRTAALIALAVLTPSAGFILESLDGMGGSEKEKFWIRSTVISTEIVALGVMFIALQSQALGQFITSTLILAGVILILPWLFHLFATWVAPHAPKSEFAFLIVVAISCAFMTKALGVYYLVGAFVVGMAAQRFRQKLPAMASEKMLEAVESFASLFVPFYFFKAGLGLRLSDFGVDSILVGLALVAIAIPLRLAAVTTHRRLAVGDDWQSGWRVGVSMLPTLVFTLVLAQILRDNPAFEIPSYLFGALIVYAVVSTMTPTWMLREAPAEFDTPQAPAVGYGVDTEEAVEQDATGVLKQAADEPTDAPEAEGDEPGAPLPERDDATNGSRAG